VYFDLRVESFDWMLFLGLGYYAHSICFSEYYLV